jgi:aminopeptidase N
MTFRDRAILVNDDTTSTDLDYVLRVVVHESAHQWFGDIVTAAWWSDLTVNEGFATLWEYYIADALKPSWEILGQTYLVNEIEALLEEDALASSHPLMNPSVQTKGDIDSMFDTISYNKGSAVWRMLMDYVTNEKFMDGMQLFLQRHQYKMATVADVVQAVQDASQIADVVQRFTAWTTKAGYPVLSVSYDGIGGQLSVAQTSAIANDSSTAWFVDLKMLSSDSPITVATKMVTETRTTTQFTVPKNLQWIKLNAGMTYLCRVKYEESMWLAFADAITGGKNASLSVVGDRFEIMNDVFAFSATNDVKISTVLTLVRALSQETEFAVWSTTLAQLSKWAVLIREQPFYGRFQSFVLNVTKVALDTVGFDPQPGESIQVSKVRSLLYATAVAYGDSATTILLAEAYKTKFDDLNADQKNVAYSAYVKVGGDAAYWEMVDRLTNSKSPGETYRVLRALASAAKPSLLQNSLTIALDPKYVRPQDTYAAFGYVASSIYGYRLAWDNLRSNWQQFEQRYGAGYTIGRFISAATASFDTPELLAEFDLFFATHRPAAGIPAIQQARERILSNIQWRQTNMAILQQWLEDNNYPLY